MLKLVHHHQQNKKLHPIIKDARKYEVDLDLTIENSRNPDLSATKQAKHVKEAAKAFGLKQLDENGARSRYMESTISDANKLKLIKRQPISDLGALN